MTLLEQATEGIRTVQIDAATRDAALKNLTTWLTEPAFASLLPQLEWLIQQKQWDGLVDRFYQILPFGTGGRRGPVGIGPNRMNLWTLGASVQEHCEYLKQSSRTRSHLSPWPTTCAFEEPALQSQAAQPVLHLSSRDAQRPASMPPTARRLILPADSPRFMATRNFPSPSAI